MMSTKDIDHVLTSAVMRRVAKVWSATRRISRSIGDAAMVVRAMLWQCWHPRCRRP
jgi:hypothetical protein